MTGYGKNEFDTSKFTNGLAYRAQSQYDLPSFGLDPDEPVFVSGPYGRGGLSGLPDPFQRPFSAQSGFNQQQIPIKRPDSSLQVIDKRIVLYNRVCIHYLSIHYIIITFILTYNINNILLSELLPNNNNQYL